MNSTFLVDLSSLAATNVFTWEAGLTVLVLVTTFNLLMSRGGKLRRTLHNSSVVTSEKLREKEEKEAGGPSGFVYESYPKLDQPNFGYKDVKVSKLLVHPIKSCRGTSLQSAKYTPEGLEFDRQWCLIDADGHAVITARDVAKMVLISPRVVRDLQSPYGGVLEVSFPPDSSCEAFSVPLRLTEDFMRTWESFDDIKLWADRHLNGYVCQSVPSLSSASIATSRTPSEILSDYFEKPVHLVIKGPKRRACPPTETHPTLQASAVYQDGYPLLVVSQENIAEVQKQIWRHVGQQGVEERWWDEEFKVERFRPNIVLSGAGAFAEDLWEAISIGPCLAEAEAAPVILVVSKCTRCLLPNVSPDTGVRDKAVPYKVLMKFRAGVDPKNKWKPCVGCNAVPLGSGAISVGDTVMVKKVAKTELPATQSKPDIIRSYK